MKKITKTIAKMAIQSNQLGRFIYPMRPMIMHSRIPLYNFSSQNQENQTKYQNQTFNELLSLNTDQSKEKIRNIFANKEKEIAQQSQQISKQTQKILNLQLSEKLLNQKVKELRVNLEEQIEEHIQIRKRLTQEKKDIKEFAIQKFAKDLLEVNDNLERALNEKQQEKKQTKTLLEGVQMTQNILEKVLATYNIKKMSSLGKIFNPDEHEALFSVSDSEKDNHTIAFVFQEGYWIGDRLLRPAKVGVVVNE